MPGEHHRDEHAGDDVGAKCGAVLVLIDMSTSSRSRSSRGTLAAARPPSMIPCTSADQLLAGGVAAAEATRCRRTGRRRRWRRCPARGRGRAGAKRPSSSSRNALPDQAGRRRVDRELGEPVEQVDLALVVPARRPSARSRPRSSAAWPRIMLVAQRLVVQRLLALLGRGVEDHALAEDRRHERVRRGLVELARPAPGRTARWPRRRVSITTSRSASRNRRRRRTRRGRAATARSGRPAARRGGR